MENKLARAISVTIGNETFKSQSKAYAHCSSILSKYQDKQTVTDKNDHQFLLDLVGKHPKSTQKIGCGVKTFFKDKAVGGTSCFYVERTDGTKEDFSFPAAVKG